DEDLLHVVLRKALRHRPFVQESPDRRPRSLLADKLLHLMEVAWLPGVGRAEQDAGPKVPVFRPRREYPSCDHHAGDPLSTEVKIQDDVFYSLFTRDPDCVLWSDGAEQLG